MSGGKRAAKGRIRQLDQYNNDHELRWYSYRYSSRDQKRGPVPYSTRWSWHAGGVVLCLCLPQLACYPLGKLTQFLPSPPNEHVSGFPRPVGIQTGSGLYVTMCACVSRISKFCKASSNRRPPEQSCGRPWRLAQYLDLAGKGHHFDRSGLPCCGNR